MLRLALAPLRRVLPRRPLRSSTPAVHLLACPLPRMMSGSTPELRVEFERKLALGKRLPPLQDNAAKLEMYALFKQANVGKNTTPKPGMLDFVGKAKWDAWSKLGDMSHDDAMKKYITIIEDLAQANGIDPSAPEGASTTTPTPTPTPTATGPSEGLLVSTSETGLLTLQFNRPARHNAINREMYNAIIDALESSAQPGSPVKAVLLKSSGATFSSGNDLSMFAPPAGGETFEEMADKGAKLLERLVDTFITYPKPIVVGVQGPAVGIAVTLLALCDLVYVSETATLHTPFTALGQSPEACSSLLFPRIMGNARANAMLLLGEKLTAQGAVEAGLATEALSIADFDTQVQTKVDLLLSRYPNSMVQSKALIRSPEVVQELQAVNRRECTALKKLWLSAECMDAVLKFQSRKKQ